MGKRDERRQKDLAKKKFIRENKTPSQTFRYLLTIGYNGSNYGGYAKQKHKNTIQNNLEAALATYFKREIKTTESSRTDAKVHALDQKVMFDIDYQVNLKKFQNEMRELLNKDIIIYKVEEVNLRFNCRYDVVDKTYEYTIAKNLDPRFLDSRWFVNKELNIEDMIKASEYLIGEHDFNTFCSAKATTSGTVRTVNFIDIIEEEDVYVFRINANGFLYNMVRLITKALVDVGSGRCEPIYVKKLLELPDKPDHLESAPGNGLCLVKINY